jgi:hypothetical protein
MAHEVEGALLVGSVPLSNSNDVFRVAAEELGGHLRRIPDGETGPRAGWVGWQGARFKLDQLELVKPVEGQYPPTPRFRPRAGADLLSLEFGDLGYAHNALESYAAFSSLREEGLIHDDVRFQVSLPTPLAPVAMFITDDAQASVEPLYEARLMQEVRALLDGVPHEDLAIQWDICIEVWMWERWLYAPFADVERGVVERIARVSNAIPNGVELGWHICYGDFQHQHFHEPTDAGVMVKMVNAMLAATRRRLDWVHLPVPIDRTDGAFFAPLSDLALPGGTELFMGVVHLRDGVNGAVGRIKAAQTYLDRFGVACECGMGRRPIGQGGDERGLRDLLALHAAVSRPVWTSR